MGSRIIHYCVGNEILKRTKLNEKQFMLGNLAPDTYSSDAGGYLVSHFRIPEEIMGDECVDLEKFKHKYNNQLNDDFVLGYYCHLITDNLWLKDAYKKYGHLELDERNDSLKLVYKDYSALNTILIDRFNLTLYNLRDIEPIHIEEIDMIFLNKLVENLEDDFIKKSDSLELKELNYDKVLEFICDAANECIREICSISDI